MDKSLYKGKSRWFRFYLFLYITNHRNTWQIMVECDWFFRSLPASPGFAGLSRCLKGELERNYWSTCFGLMIIKT